MIDNLGYRKRAGEATTTDWSSKSVTDMRDLVASKLHEAVSSGQLPWAPTEDHQVRGQKRDPIQHTEDTKDVPSGKMGWHRPVALEYARH